MAEKRPNPGVLPQHIENRERLRFRLQDEVVEEVRHRLLAQRELLRRMYEQNRALTALRRQLIAERRGR